MSHSNTPHNATDKSKVIPGGGPQLKADLDPAAADELGHDEADDQDMGVDEDMPEENAADDGSSDSMNATPAIEGMDNSGAGVSASAVNHATNILGIFDGMTFPASKMEIVAFAEDADASEDVLDHLQAIPDDIYNSLGDLDRHFNDIEIIEESDNLWSSEESHDIGVESDRLIADLNGNDIHIK